MAIADPSSETTERQQLVRFALRDGDPFTIVHLLARLTSGHAKPPNCCSPSRCYAAATFPSTTSALGVAAQEFILVVS